MPIKLTPNQKKISILLSKGLTEEQIADELNITVVDLRRENKIRLRKLYS